jgi:hypothetical protein
LGWAAHTMVQQSESQTSASQDTESVAQPISENPPDTARPQSTPTQRRSQSDAKTEFNNSAASSDAEKEISETPESTAFVLVPDRSSDALAMPSSDRGASAGEGTADKDPLADLLSSVTIWCRFDPGNGAQLQDGNITMYELSYQGGPISYDSINIESGTARMIGSAGATGSPEGVLDVLVTATRSGLHFSAVNSRGELTVTTVFGAVDKHGRHSAVMTTHGTHAFNGSYQAYGACDTGSPKPDG